MCETGEDDNGTSSASCSVSYQANGTDGSLAETSPRPRKRKLKRDADEDRSKRSSASRSDINLSRYPQANFPSTMASSSPFMEGTANLGDPTLLERTLGLQTDRYSRYIGPTTEYEPALIDLAPFDLHGESVLKCGRLRKVSERITFLLPPDNQTPGIDRVLADADEIERIVAPYGRQLIDVYFSVVHPAFPILQKTACYDKYTRSFREFSPPLLAVIYLLAINWWDHSKHLAALSKPDVTALERLLRTSLADAMSRPKLSTMQAGLLLAQRPGGDQWAPTAQLVAIGQELGLHLDCSDFKIPPWEKGLRKRLAWALYMQDKWCALVHGRPSHISASNWAVRPLKSSDFPDGEWNDGQNEDRVQIEAGRTLFMQMVQLSQILAEVLEAFYTLQATETVTSAGRQGTQLVLSFAKPIQLKLKEWYTSLPNSVRLEPSPSSSSHFPACSSVETESGPSIINSPRLSSIGYLHLAYFATEITLHRRIIHSIDESSAKPPLELHRQHMLFICRSAAKARLISAMDFVNRLTPSHLCSFWYFASKTNFALIGTFGSLLRATSPGREEAEWYRRRLCEYRWTLCVSARPGEGARGLTEWALGMLDISAGLLRRLPEKPEMAGRNMGEGCIGGFQGSPAASADVDGGFGGPSVDQQDWNCSEEASEGQCPLTSQSSGEDEDEGDRKEVTAEGGFGLGSRLDMRLV